MVLVGLGGYRYRYVFKVEDVSGKKNLSLALASDSISYWYFFLNQGQMFTAAGSVIPVGIRIGCNGDPDPGALS